MTFRRHGRLSIGLSPVQILIVSAVFIVLYFGVSAAGNSYNDQQLKREQSHLEREIRDLAYQRQRVDALRTYMQTDEFIERSGRDIGLVRPGDTAVVVSGPPSTTPPSVDGERPWYERYFGNVASDRGAR